MNKYSNTGTAGGLMYVCMSPMCQPGEETVPGPRESVFEFEDLQLLPLRDVALMGGANLTHQFGFTVGPLCFS